MWFPYFLIEKAPQAEKNGNLWRKHEGNVFLKSLNPKIFACGANIFPEFTLSRMIEFLRHQRSVRIPQMLFTNKSYIHIGSVQARWGGTPNAIELKHSEEMHRCLVNGRGDPDRAPLLLLKFRHLVSRSKRIPEFAIMFCKSKHWIATMGDVVLSESSVKFTSPRN